MTQKKDLLYYYRALVTKVYDGDTITCDIDLGMGVWLHAQKIRLAGINAPELRGEERHVGLRSKLYLEGLLMRKVPIYIKTTKDRSFKDKKGKYGRWIGHIFLEDGTHVNILLVEKGFAKSVIY
jgi:micrococcal nuclease